MYMWLPSPSFYKYFCRWRYGNLICTAVECETFYPPFSLLLKDLLGNSWYDKVMCIDSSFCFYCGSIFRVHDVVLNLSRSLHLPSYTGHLVVRVVKVFFPSLWKPSRCLFWVTYDLMNWDVEVSFVFGWSTNVYFPLSFSPF